MHVLRMLGTLDIRSDDGAAVQSVLAQPKRAAVLCYLTAARPLGFQPRDALIAMFWPEQDEQRARNALSQAVAFLRRSLGKDSVLNRGNDDLAVNRDCLRCDAVELEQLLERGAVEKALGLYEHDLLHGFHVSDAPAFEQWVDEERSRLRDVTANAAAEHALRLRAQKHLHSACEWMRRSSALAPYNQQRACSTLELLIEAGEQPAAIAFYEAFAERLWRDLELKPSAVLRGLMERARAVAHDDGARRGMTAAAAHAGSNAARLPVTHADTADPVGQLNNELVPEFEVMRQLGRGSTAVAFLAREPALKRLVTLKLLRAQLAADPIALHRFEREAQAAARISHTNVATVYRVGRLTSGIPYIVMEYVDGRSLADTIAARGPLPQNEARRILAALASALAAAHEHGIIHRDVRPGNIFIENRGGRVVLTDFGIAALLESGMDGATQLTPAGTRLGEIRYASPEQARGERVTELSDVYAFGIVALELLTGCHPFDSGEPGVVEAGAELAFASNPEMRHKLPADLRNVIERCLSKEANRRPRAQDLMTLLTVAH